MKHTVDREKKYMRNVRRMLYSIVCIMGIVALLFACEEPGSSAAPPAISNVTASGITTSGATISANVTNGTKLFWVAYNDGTTVPRNAATLIAHASIPVASGDTIHANSGADGVNVSGGRVTIPITGLAQDTAYDIYAAVQNSDGAAVLSGKVDLMTEAIVITISDLAASNVTFTGATITASIANATTLFWALYSDGEAPADATALITAAGSNFADIATIHANSGSSGVTIPADGMVSIPITGLTPSTAYDFYAVAQYAPGIARLSAKFDLMTAAITIDNIAARDITFTGATITADTTNGATLFWVLYSDGEVPADAAALIADSARTVADVPTIHASSGASGVTITNTGPNAGDVSVPITGLTQSTAYDFYAVVQNGVGNVTLSPKFDLMTTVDLTVIPSFTLVNTFGVTTTNTNFPLNTNINPLRNVTRNTPNGDIVNWPTGIAADSSNRIYVLSHSTTISNTTDNDHYSGPPTGPNSWPDRDDANTGTATAAYVRVYDSPTATAPSKSARLRHENHTRVRVGDSSSSPFAISTIALDLDGRLYYSSILDVSTGLYQVADNYANDFAPLYIFGRSRANPGDGFPQVTDSPYHSKRFGVPERNVPVQSMTVAPNGDFVYHFESVTGDVECCLYTFRPLGSTAVAPNQPYYQRRVARYALGAGQNNGMALATDSAGRVYAGKTGSFVWNRFTRGPGIIVFSDTTLSTPVLADISTVGNFDGDDTTADETAGVTGIAVDEHGRIYVADYDNRQVIIYQGYGNTDNFGTIKLDSGGNNYFQRPFRVLWNNGYLYVTDFIGNQVKVFRRL